MAYTNALGIIEKLRDLLRTPVLAQTPTMTLNLDEPINLVFSDLPMLSTYPVREDFVLEESTNNQNKKHLTVRIEVRVKGGPSSSICTPLINTIADTIRANPRLDGLATYVEIQSIQWASDTTSSGIVSGAALDVMVQYLIA